jgi:ribonuclease HII
MMLGIDEAGKGPTLGPIVMAGCLTTPEIDAELQALGVRDSKLITPKRREQMFEMVKEKVLAWHIAVVQPEEIDAALNSETLNLNKLEGVTSLKIIAEIYKKSEHKKFTVMMDSPSNNPKGYLDYLHTMFSNKDITLKAETKADMNHISVGAASILAKVTRDRLIAELETTIGQKIGSGYPADPYTKKFLEGNWDKDYNIKGGLWRKTWATWKNMAKAKAQKGLGEF